MCLHGVFRVTPKGLDGQVLLDPLEEGLYLPAVPIQVGHVKRTHLGEVGDEGQHIAAVRVGELHHPEVLGIELARLVARQTDGAVADESCGTVDVVVDIDHLVAHVALRSRDPVGIALADVVERSEVHVSLVHHIDRPRDYLDDIQHVAVVPLAVGDVDEGRDTTPQVEDGVHLDRSSVVFAVCPHHQFDAARHRGGVDGENLPAGEVDIRNGLVCIEWPDQTYQHKPELLPNAAVTVTVRSRKRGDVHRLAEPQWV